MMSVIRGDMRVADFDRGRVPPDGEWDPDGLEAVRVCPLCGSGKRAPLHVGIQDRVFFTAPGEWNLWRCRGCGCGFLDPRPDRDSIAMAYKQYYTHSPSVSASSGSSAVREALRWFKYGFDRRFLNWRYGHQLKPAVIGGAVLRRILPSAGRKAEHRIRHLPPPRPGRNRVLDIGCGNGTFLSVARELGYDVTGLEFDAAAAEVARAGGFEVVDGRVPGSALDPERYDVITLNHVIEHLHDPLGALVECRNLLRDGGRLWIKTPNIDSAGHSRYGSAWRGLEPPRHLVLFGPQALMRALRASGFVGAELIAPEPEADFYFESSEAIASGLDPYGEFKPSPELARVSRACDREAARNPQRGESITVVAWKGSRESGRKASANV